MAEYIDRQAAMDCMMDCQHDFRDGCVWIPRHEAVTRLEKTQSADVQPVQHGKWIKAQRKGITSYGDGFAECDKCHEVSWLGWNDKYCRNCGARMDGEL